MLGACRLSWAIVTVAALAGLGPVYHDARLHFSFQPPDGWTRVTDDVIPSTAVAYVGAKDGEVSPSIVVLNEVVGDETLEQYTKAIKLQTARSTDISYYQFQSTKVGGLPAEEARAHVHLAKHPEKPATDVHQVFIIRNKRGYIITLTARPGSMSKFDPVLKKMLSSFTWEPQTPAKAK